MHTSQPPQIHEFGDFRIDTARRLLLGGDGLPRSLAPKAFDTLLYLVQQGDVILDKEVLMKAVWPDTIVEENNLNQHISILRRVLGGNRREHRYILTVPGRGYRFVAAVRSYAPHAASVSIETIKSLAVLPFRPLVAGDSDSSLEIGMADTLIARLSGIRNMVVRPISSVRKYADSAQDAFLAGRELGVESVLEGSLQRAVGKIRVTVRLLTVSNGACLWAATFDERFTDIFTLQDAISERVVRALQLKLSSDDQLRLLKHHTENTQAYQLYLKGRFYWWQNAPEEFRKSREYFHRAVDADPSYALGYCGLNSFYGFGAAWGMLPAEEAWPKAQWAIKKALKLDDSLAEAHLGFAALKMVYYLDWRAAEKHARRAIELNPHFDEAHYMYSFYLGVMGRWDEAIAEGQRALACDPFSVRLCQHLGNTFYNARRYHEAIRQFEQTLQLDPHNASVHEALADVYHQQGQSRQAIGEWKKFAHLAKDAELAAIFAGPVASRDFPRILRALAAMRLARLRHKAKKHGNVPAINFARVYLQMDDKKNALGWLKKACQERNVFALTLASDPLCDPLRRDRRFHALLLRLKLKPAAQA
jgi:TolB-like protein/DNA-binding SARP family transcriptional activator